MLNCPQCDWTCDDPDDGWLYAVRHQDLFGARQHELVMLTKKVKSVKEIEE